MHTNKEEQTIDGHLGWICWPQPFGRRMREPVFWKMLRCRHGMELHRWKNWMLSFVLADSVVSYHLSFWRIATSVESIERAKGAGCTVDVLSLGRFNLEVMNWPNVCDKFSVQYCTTMSLIEPTCRNVLLTMLPKSRDSTQPNYCRPIVVLKFTNKMLSNLLYGRPHATLHMEQCFNETGFKPHTGIDDATINAKSKWPDNTVSFFSHRMEQIPPRDHTTTHNVCHYIRCKLNPLHLGWLRPARGRKLGPF